ncbi:glycoside hydrolase family 43 protein [Paenibacillus senegalimassiliensis]|uniref:glycoside hydrolase family 43 protein n=1 Tax=Paenibacillus senegalimassiliensis TaxID=1737426 RepID=UPI00073F3CB3|nr:glycoside hydrolase family 43 protein [Paenibacillus senegalimassiliensis]
MIQNPILRGFNPDPCILRAGDVYYIVVSSFQWLPGVRVYRSDNLTDWEHCTDLLTDQVDLRGNPKDCSVWAPQLSWHDGLFYLIYSDVKSTRRPFKDVHNYLITAPSINGPWSEPIYLNGSGFDPSLFHDEDGRKWLLNEIWDYRIPEGNKSSGIVMQEYDPRQRRLVGKPIKLFDGTALKKTEAPHIYKRNGYYYLVTAEGGTGSGHAVTVARSLQLEGPYEVDPHNPMLTSRDDPALPLQCAGHGSLVETPGGEWYMAHLCTRPVEGKYAILGRETALQQVYWDDEGWLRLSAGGNTPQIKVPAPRETLLTASGEKPASDKDSGRGRHALPYRFQDDFDGDVLQSEWNTLRMMPNESWCSLKKRPGYLRLTAGESPQSLFRHHLLAIRQRDVHFRAETCLDYAPYTYLQMAGLLLYLNEDNYLYAYISHEESQGKVLRLLRCAGDEVILEPEPVLLPNEGAVHLAVEVRGTEARFYCRAEEPHMKDHPAEAGWQAQFAAQPISFLSGGFTGNFVGIAAHDMQMHQGSYADFSNFHYEGYDQ